MKKKYRSMLVGGTLSSMIVPILLLSDTLIAGSMIGDAAVAGINLVLPVYSFASFFAMLCSLGVPILYSGAIGRFQKDEADRIFATGITASLGCGALLFVLLTLFDDTYLAFYGASADVLAHAVPYMLWMRWIVLLLPISNYLLAMIFADGTKR